MKKFVLVYILSIAFLAGGLVAVIGLEAVELMFR